MEYTEINGKKVSKISLGTVQLGMDYGIANKTGAPSMRQSFDILETALSGGITAVDTARSYGCAEDVLGEFFRSYGKELPFITTKYKCNLNDDADYAAVERDVFQSVETSLKKLNINKIDCLLLHNVFSTEIKQGANVSRAFEKLIKENYIKTAGLSVARYAEEIDAMLQYDVFRAAQTPMNILDVRVLSGGYLDKLIARGVYVFVRSVFFQGLFFLDSDKIENPALKELAGKYIKKIRLIAEEENMSVSELAIAYIRDMKGVTSLVLGAETKEQVTENLKFLNSPAISENGRRKIREQLSGADVLAIMRELAAPKK